MTLLTVWISLAYGLLGPAAIVRATVGVLSAIVMSCQVYSAQFRSFAVFFCVKLSPPLTLPSVARNVPQCGAEFHVSVVSWGLPVIVR